MHVLKFFSLLWREQGLPNLNREVKHYVDLILI